ncbi:hypothetical protein VNI00_007739 [Paramarasmius palmivorus]|uniref:F-box domain-containing protein n=1 Tax=Paramarasmius palmivorus TaxID=297713 RepID=A0AAW0D089_9AGAR
MSLLGLPSDIFLEVASRLDLLDAYSLSITCRFIRDLSQAQAAYWANVLTSTRRMLPLPPYENIRLLSISTVWKIALHMVVLQNNLDKEQPVLKQPVIQHDLAGQIRNHHNLTIIPGTPLILLGLKNIERLSCFDYLRGQTLCSTDFTGHLHEVSAPMHQYRKSTVVVQIATNIMDENPSLYVWTVEYSVTDQDIWSAKMTFSRIPKVRMDPMAGLPLYAICTDAEIVAYTIPMNHGNPGKLKVVAHELHTGTTTTIITDMAIGMDVNDYILTLKDRELFIIREDNDFTCIWTIPFSFLPYPGNPTEIEANYTCASNPYYHRYETEADPSYLSLFANTTTRAHFDNSILSDLQATLISNDAVSGDDALFRYRRWTLPDAQQQYQVSDTVPFNVERPDACDGPRSLSSVSSLLYTSSSGRKRRKVRELMLGRFQEGRLSHHRLQKPDGLDLHDVANLVFDEGLGVALVLLCDETLVVLRYGMA